MQVTSRFLLCYQAGYIAEVLTLAALQGGKNVLQDGSLRDHTWYQLHFQKLKRDFPQVRQAIIHVTAPRNAILDRAAVSVQMSTGSNFESNHASSSQSSYVFFLSNVQKQQGE